MKGLTRWWWSRGDIWLCIISVGRGSFSSSYLFFGERLARGYLGLSLRHFHSPRAAHWALLGRSYELACRSLLLTSVFRRSMQRRVDAKLRKDTAQNNNGEDIDPEGDAITVALLTSHAVKFCPQYLLSYSYISVSLSLGQRSLFCSG